jgi:phosphoglycerol transferase MdoB-like AlkP superfamily enzyme
VQTDEVILLEPEEPNAGLLLRAFWCAVVPIIGGLGILLLYWIYRWKVLPYVGLAWLGIGLMSIYFGSSHLGRYWLSTGNRNKSGAESSRRFC